MRYEVPHRLEAQIRAALRQMIECLARERNGVGCLAPHPGEVTAENGHAAGDVRKPSHRISFFRIQARRWKRRAESTLRAAQERLDIVQTSFEQRGDSAGDRK